MNGLEEYVLKAHLKKDVKRVFCILIRVSETHQQGGDKRRYFRIFNDAPDLMNTACITTCNGYNIAHIGF